ncbi:hypothetical protein DPMN_054782 [Dreissena polymorpha]|uniref:Uncharacterized protein n=1 Tax=Dreissena polymorpha TaxID=45954 RepID=A0A9D4CNR2_DREPO|nr:hypothetical protein DPMN_054782 [Dreissena polymorpha]
MPHYFLQTIQTCTFDGNRFEMGQAVELKPNYVASEENLFRLAIALIRIAKSVHTQQIGIGVGCKADRLYFDVRPIADENDFVVEVWDSGNTPLFNRLKLIQDMIVQGMLDYALFSLSYLAALGENRALCMCVKCRPRLIIDVGVVLFVLIKCLLSVLAESVVPD